MRLAGEGTLDLKNIGVRLMQTNAHNLQSIGSLEWSADCPRPALPLV
jgi:hypothetical protein